MKNPIIISTGSCHRYGLARFFEIAKKAGFKQLELIIDDRLDNQEPKYIKKLERKFGLKVTSVHAAMEFVGSWGDPKNRLEKSIKLAKDLKAKYLIVHSWDYTDPHHLPWLLKNQKSIINLAKPVKVVFENATCRYDKITKAQINPAYHYDVLKQFDTINLDTSHIATAEMDILEYYEQIKDKVQHIHFSDSDMHLDDSGKVADCHYVPGKGKLPLKKFLKTLKADKYSGPISIELWCDQFADKKGNITEEAVIKNLKAAKKFVNTYFK